MFRNYQVILITTTKGFPPMLWYCITQASIARKVCVNFVLLLEFCKRQELSFLIYIYISRIINLLEEDDLELLLIR